MMFIKLYVYWYINGVLPADHGSACFLGYHIDNAMESRAAYIKFDFFKVCTDDEIKLICMLKLDVFCR